MSLAPRTKRKPLANVQITFKAEPALARLLEERASLSKQSRHTLARELVEESLRNEHDVIPVLNRATDKITGLHELLSGQAEASTLLLQKFESLDSQYDFLAKSLAQLVAHNAAWDLEFLHSWYERLKIFCPARRQALCTVQRCLWYFFENPSRTPQNFRLETLCQHFSVPFSAAEAHDAMGDVCATVGLYRALIARTTTVSYSTAA